MTLGRPCKTMFRQRFKRHSSRAVRCLSRRAFLLPRRRVQIQIIETFLSRLPNTPTMTQSRFADASARGSNKSLKRIDSENINREDLVEAFTAE